MLLNSDTDAIITAIRLNSLTLRKTSLNDVSPKVPIDWRRERRKMTQTINGQKSKKAACKNSVE